MGPGGGRAAASPLGTFSDHPSLAWALPPDLNGSYHTCLVSYALHPMA